MHFICLTFQSFTITILTFYLQEYSYWQNVRGFGKLYIKFYSPSKGSLRICERSNISNGQLLPDQYHAPIFLIGDTMKVACDDGYQINNRDQSRNVTIICGEQTDLPRKCVRKVNKHDVHGGGDTKYFDGWFSRAFMGVVVFLVILMIILMIIRLLRANFYDKIKRWSNKPVRIDVGNIVMENAHPNLDSENASSENRDTEIAANIEIAANCACD